MAEMIYGKTEGGRDFVKVVSDERVLLGELSDFCFEKEIYNEMGRHYSTSFLMVYDVTEAEFTELYQLAREATDDLYQQAMRADYESEFEAW